jgi:hypothetical protein
MKVYEEFARLKANEAIQQGLAAQRFHREMQVRDNDQKERRVKGKYYLLTLITLAIGLALVGVAAAQGVF